MTAGPSASVAAEAAVFSDASVGASGGTDTNQSKILHLGQSTSKGVRT